jgi:hypothetical protein
MLRQAVTQMDPAAVEYIDWQHFEAELEKVMGVTDPAKPKVTAVFGQAVTRARQRYQRAVMDGTRFSR